MPTAPNDPKFEPRSSSKPRRSIRSAWTPELCAIVDQEIVRAGVAPGGVLGLAEWRAGSGSAEMDSRSSNEAGGSWALGFGYAGSTRGDASEPIGPDTIYDLASVTKPFVACAALWLLRYEPNLLSARLEELLPELRGTQSAELPFEWFLCHRAGLEAHLPLYEKFLSGKLSGLSSALHEAANARRPDLSGASPASAGFPPVYSDLGYFLAGAALERVAQRLGAASSLEELVQLCRGSLGWTGFLGCAAQLPKAAQVAPTEIIEWRGGTILREVHDENAFVFKGLGLAGHAGLFGDARLVLEFGVELLDCLNNISPWIQREVLEAALKPRPGGSYRLGFDGKSEHSSAGQYFSSQSFGHLGFTGTSLWCDPQARRAVVLLTNRVYPSREAIEIRQARPRIHDRVSRLADPQAGPGPG